MVFNNISTIFQLYRGTPIKIVDINELNAIMIMLYRKKKEMFCVFQMDCGRLPDLKDFNHYGMELYPPLY